MGVRTRLQHAQELADKGKRDEISYAQEKDKDARTADTTEALKKMDCSEFVCRVLASDGLIGKNDTYNTDSLLHHFKTSGKFEKSDPNNPQPGDIYIRKEGGGHPGHTGVVKDFNKTKNEMHTLEAMADHKKHPNLQHDVGERNYRHTRDQKTGEKVDQFDNLVRSDTFGGFWHPKKENPDPQDKESNDKKDQPDYPQGKEIDEDKSQAGLHKLDQLILKNYIEAAKKRGDGPGDIQKIVDGFTQKHGKDVDKNKKESPQNKQPVEDDHKEGGKPKTDEMKNNKKESQSFENQGKQDYQKKDGEQRKETNDLPTDNGKQKIEDKIDQSKKQHATDDGKKENTAFEKQAGIGTGSQNSNDGRKEAAPTIHPTDQDPANQQVKQQQVQDTGM